MLKDLNPPRRHSRHPSAGGEFISCFFVLIWDGTVHIYTIIFHFCIVCAVLSVLFLSKTFLFILFQVQGGYY